MKVVEVTRTISGNNYDNVTAKAILEDGDTIQSVAVMLNKELKKALDEINGIRRQAIKDNEGDGMPF